MGLLEVVVLSMLPFAELRGGIPLGVATGMRPAVAFLAAVIANIAIVPLIFLFLDTAHRAALRIRPYQKLFAFFLERTRKKAEEKIGRWGYFGLFLLVAVPLPVTGAYTGTLAAWFLELDRKKAFVAIAGGVVAAGIVVTAVVLTGAEALRLFVK